MSKRGLGKGLDALLSTSSLAREKQQVATQSQTLSSDGKLTELSINFGNEMPAKPNLSFIEPISLKSSVKLAVGTCSPLSFFVQATVPPVSTTPIEFIPLIA